MVMWRLVTDLSGACAGTKWTWVVGDRIVAQWGQDTGEKEKSWGPKLTLPG